MQSILTIPPHLCQLRKRPPLLPHPDKKKRRIHERENNRRRPRPEDERKREYLHDDHDIVRVREIFIWPAPHEPLARHDEYFRIPPIPEEGNRPTTPRLREKKENERNHPPRRKRHTSQNPLDERGGEPRRMERDHHRIMPPPELDRPAGAEPLFVPPRKAKLEKPLSGDEKNRAHEKRDAHQTSVPLRKNNPVDRLPANRPLAAKSRDVVRAAREGSFERGRHENSKLEISIEKKRAPPKTPAPSPKAPRDPRLHARRF